MTTNQDLPAVEWLKLAYHRLTSACEYAEQAQRYIDTANAKHPPGLDVGLYAVAPMLRSALDRLAAYILTHEKDQLHRPQDG